MTGTTTRKFSQVILTALLALPLFALGAAKASASIPPENFQSHLYTFGKTVAPWAGSMYKEAGAATEYALGKQGPVLTLGGNAKDGYALFSNSGADAVWMQANYKATAMNVFFSFDVQDVKNGGRLAPIIYVGKKAPVSVYQFQKLGYPLLKGKQTLYYQLDLIAAGLYGQEFVIAIGFMNLDQVQQGQRASVDNVRVMIHDGD